MTAKVIRVNGAGKTAESEPLVLLRRSDLLAFAAKGADAARKRQAKKSKKLLTKNKALVKAEAEHVTDIMAKAADEIAGMTEYVEGLNDRVAKVEAMANAARSGPVRAVATDHGKAAELAELDRRLALDSDPAVQTALRAERQRLLG